MLDPAGAELISLKNKLKVQKMTTDIDEPAELALKEARTEHDEMKQAISELHSALSDAMKSFNKITSDFPDYNITSVKFRSNADILAVEFIRKNKQLLERTERMVK